MKIRRFASDVAAARALAARIASLLGRRPDLVLGLPTGRTSIALYRELVRLHARGRADFSRATTFNLDEFVGLGARDPGSYRAFMQRHFFGRVNLDPRRVHFLDGGAPDLDAECARYEAAIREAGGIGLQILGIGTNGHIGFNEPGHSLIARTHRVRLRPETRRANALLFGGRWRRVPGEALSMGIATILEARRIAMLATGRGKARPVTGLVEGRVTTRLPASFLQLHPDVELFLDRAAASRLRTR